MSFATNQSGLLFEKDLGEDTAILASAIERFDPDKSWTPVRDRLPCGDPASRCAGAHGSSLPAAVVARVALPPIRVPKL